MKLRDSKETVSFNQSRIDLVGAVVAGLAVGLFSCFTNILYYPPSGLLYTRFIVTSVGAYLLIAVLTHSIWTRLARVIIPTYIVVSVFGSVIFAVVDLSVPVIRGWRDPLRLEHTGVEYFFTEINAAKSVIIVLILITLPITALVHYSRRLVAAINSWHDGDPTPSILYRPRR